MHRLIKLFVKGPESKVDTFSANASYDYNSKLIMNNNNNNTDFSKDRVRDIDDKSSMVERLDDPSEVNKMDDRHPSSLESETNLNVEEKSTNLENSDVWNRYYKRLQTIGREIINQNGWSHFDKVFMISALSGDGVLDLKDYLLSRTYPSTWLHHPSLVTDQNPIELARMCVWERLLDNLPDEIPYSIDLRLSCWEVSEDGLLIAAFDIICYKKRHLHYVLGKDGSTVRRIAAEAKQELMNTFRKELSLKLLVKGARGVADPEKLQRHE